MVNRYTLNVINRTGLSDNCLIVFAAIYHALTVASGCYHSDRSVTYVSYTIVGFMQTFAMTHSVWMKFAVTLCIPKTHTTSRRKNTLTLLIQKVDAVAHVVWKADDVTYIVWRTFALTLCVCKRHAVFQSRIP